MLAIMRDHQRGSGADNPAIGRGGQLKAWLQVEPTSKRLVFHDTVQDAKLTDVPTCCPNYPEGLGQMRGVRTPDRAHNAHMLAIATITATVVIAALAIGVAYSVVAAFREAIDN